jgi:hypothetical protein
MPKATSRSVSLFAAGTVVVGLCLWNTLGIRPRNAGFYAANPAMDRPERSETPAVPVVAAAFLPPQSEASFVGQPSSETPPLGTWGMTLRELAAIAASDPDAALVRVAELNEAEERQAALKEVCAVVALRDPGLAFAAAWRFELGKLGGLAEVLALENLAKAWASRDPEGALAWTAREPHDKAGLRDHVVKGIAAALSREFPDGAALLIAEGMSDNHPRFEAAATLAGERTGTGSFPSSPDERQRVPSRRNGG